MEFLNSKIWGIHYITTSNYAFIRNSFYEISFSKNYRFSDLFSLYPILIKFLFQIFILYIYIFLKRLIAGSMIFSNLSLDIYTKSSSFFKLSPEIVISILIASDRETLQLYL